MGKKPKIRKKIGIKISRPAYTGKSRFFTIFKKERDGMQEYSPHPVKVHAPENELPPEVTRWLHVSGDLDDFIYYEEEPVCSER